MENEKNKPEDFNDDEKPLDELSGDEILNQIEEDASEHLKQDSGMLRKLGLSKNKNKKESEDWKKKYDELNDKYLRLFADFDNSRKRNLKERIELSKTAGAEVIISLLPVLDDFNRALRQMEAADDPMTEGVRLIYQKMLSILETKGLKAMKSLGEEFNPELHEAIAEVPVQDENMAGKIADEIETGYYLNDKIIRHAKVVVGK